MSIRMSTRAVLASLVGITALVCATDGRAIAQTDAGSWLDQPLSGWNTRATAVPVSPKERDETREALVARCDLHLANETEVERILARSGWIPFRYFDRQLREHDIEIVGGLTGSDGMCRPTAFNVFVFIGGRYAGTLSPILMNSRTDGVSGAIRILDADAIAVEYARYEESDALCCPASRVTVTFRVDRSGAGASVIPTEIRTTRSY